MKSINQGLIDKKNSLQVENSWNDLTEPSEERKRLDVIFIEKCIIKILKLKKC